MFCASFRLHHVPIESGKRFRDALRCEHIRFFQEEDHFVSVVCKNDNQLNGSDIAEGITRFNAMPDVAPVTLLKTEAPTLLSWYTDSRGYLKERDVQNVVCYNKDVALDVPEEQATDMIRDIIRKSNTAEDTQTRMDRAANFNGHAINTVLYLESMWGPDDYLATDDVVTIPEYLGPVEPVRSVKDCEQRREAVKTLGFEIEHLGTVDALYHANAQALFTKVAEISALLVEVKGATSADNVRKTNAMAELSALNAAILGMSRTKLGTHSTKLKKRLRNVEYQMEEMVDEEKDLNDRISKQTILYNKKCKSDVERLTREEARADEVGRKQKQLTDAEEEYNNDLRVGKALV